MSGVERYVEYPTVTALSRLRDELRTPILAWGPVLEVNFPAANTKRDIRHGLSVTPSGVLIILAIGGNVRGSDITNWSPDLAYLQADVANTRARVIFILTEVPTNA